MTTLPVAAGERHGGVAATMELIEKEIVDVVQPDMGRSGGLTQMKRIAAMAEVRAHLIYASQLCVSILLSIASSQLQAHYITFAPHDGSLGPVAEMASLQLCATLPNFLIDLHSETYLEHETSLSICLPAHACLIIARFSA